MIIRKLKLKLNHTQEDRLNGWLWNLTGVWNWAIKKIERDAADKIYYSLFDFQNLLAGHSKKLGIPSHTIQGIAVQAHTAWSRCFKKTAKKPRLKGRRNQLNSIPFPDPFSPPKNNRVRVAGLGWVRFYKQELPEGKIKCGRIIKRPSGWYLCLWIDAVHTFPVKETDKAVGMDPGFSTLLTLSDGTKFENPRELRKGAERLAQAQRGGDKKLAARLLERQSQQRNDRNHKISRKLIENYSTIYYCKDNFRGLSRSGFGKSVTEAANGQLIGMLAYKAVPAARKVMPVTSVKTTMTCSACGALTGPTGRSGLAVRDWTCSACGAYHDRDVNSAVVAFNTGAGCALKEHSNALN